SERDLRIWDDQGQEEGMGYSWWEYPFLLVAGTDKEDIRRMSVAYVADGEPAIFVNFLAEDGCLTGREKRLLISLRGFQ
ncbi:MAG: hypothetical protein LUG54_00780, partial [Clostridiales bacterium]|nr:hypothetical protein [Clostridiales bacterium]